MSPSLSKLALVLCLAGIGAYAQRKAPAKKAAPSKTVTTAPKKSAFDKPTLEAYVRHLYFIGPQYKVEIGPPKPSTALPGFDELAVHVVWPQGSQDVPLFVTRDGQKLFAGSVYDINQNPFKPELDKLKTELSPSFGTPGATVVIVLFTDFQCPYCKEEAKMLRQNLLSAYPKQVRVYFKDLPLEQLHPWAKSAAIAGRCVFRQNASAFWDYYDWIYDHQSEITLDNLKSKVLEWAKGRELDSLQLTRCIDTRATEPEVDKEIAEARALAVPSTPTMFVNGRRVVGSRGWPELRSMIDFEIEYQKTAHNAGEDCGCAVDLPIPADAKPGAPALGH